ncbi:hypothetical protein EMIHUDRAFT_256033 [Emiliania huxleyi CCMP1516]|uniref:Uncharacterized protein n=2 Tax=Emiliania huxleyi TaxID=2903 RepID=A0A0D3J0K5_EMIH1|nr:hypothetical protein EMIHUDRAFT_256033 [Emiliania huxleyi CCMP1516]EOD17040.1 hypothetical protein EMIHUDRAFT_256033 [Emiliania huxleyi CCMP1516]|eukprot:XP_005769469.1 hypothetical protein EMIHUDRAFT_256033 [Emiliania huxleyi CCMP1516]
MPCPKHTLRIGRVEPAVTAPHVRVEWVAGVAGIVGLALPSTLMTSCEELRVSSTAGAVSPACGGLPPEGYNSASEAKARGGALRMVARVAKQRAIQVTRHWQAVGIPLESLGMERFPTLAACHGCGG